MNNEQSLIKEIWVKAKSLVALIFMGFLYGIFSLVILAMLLQWTLEIDITELDNIHRLLFLSWGICTVGWYFYLKNQEERRKQK